MVGSHGVFRFPTCMSGRYIHHFDVIFVRLSYNLFCLISGSFFARYVAKRVFLVADCGLRTGSDCNLIPFWCVHCPLRLEHPVYLDKFSTFHHIVCYVLLFFIKLVLYGTPVLSMAINASIHGASAFHLAPRMPFQCRYHVHHTTSPVRALQAVRWVIVLALSPCVTFCFNFRYNIVRYTPVCAPTPSVAVCNSMPSWYPRSHPLHYLRKEGIPSFLLCVRNYRTELQQFRPSVFFFFSPPLPSVSPPVSWLHALPSFGPSLPYFRHLIIYFALSSPCTQTSAHCLELPPRNCFIDCNRIRCDVIIAHLFDGFCTAFRFGLRFATRSGNFPSFITHPFAVLSFVCGGSSCV